MFTKKEMAIGLSALLLLAGMNFCHALGGYGFPNGNLCENVWASTDSGGSSSSTKSSSNKSSSSSFSFDGDNWNTSDTHGIGSDWKPVLTACTHTESVGAPPYVVSVSYQGKMVVCQAGNGNCYNGSPCIADPVK